MLSSFYLIAALTFVESKGLALQIHLDRAGFSCNTIDGNWGVKSEQAAAAFLASRGQDTEDRCTLSPNVLYDRAFADAPDPMRIEDVTSDDLAALVQIPKDPAARAKLPRMGYESVKEMFAERGHLSQIALARLNPGVDWDHVRPGLKLVIPDFPSIREEIKSGNCGHPKRPRATLVKVSLSQRTITALDAQGRLLARFPCSIAANKAKVPPQGELKIVTHIAWPNYTYTPDYTPPGKKVQRFVWPAGENCPVGVVWMGLNLPGYGIHGTPTPESIGFTGSHGCFRLANWNAARLFAMCRPGTRVLIEP